MLCAATDVAIVDGLAVVESIVSAVRYVFVVTVADNVAGVAPAAVATADAVGADASATALFITVDAPTNSADTVNVAALFLA